MTLMLSWEGAKIQEHHREHSFHNWTNHNGEQFIDTSKQANLKIMTNFRKNHVNHMTKKESYDQKESYDHFRKNHCKCQTWNLPNKHW